MENNTVYTIGHAKLPIPVFLRILKYFDINSLVDIRSKTLLNYMQQFNQDKLNALLPLHGIYYLYFGREFGERQYECMTVEGRVDLNLVAKSRSFIEGVERIETGLRRGNRIVIMGTPGNPMQCHRFALIGRALSERGIEVLHIMDTECSVCSHVKLERQMIVDYCRAGRLREAGNGLFDNYTLEQQRADAYILKNKEVGFFSKKSDIYE